MQPEVGSTWIYEVSCSWAAENVHSVFFKDQREKLSTKTWVASALVSRKASAMYLCGKKTSQNSTILTLGFLGNH